MRLPAVEVEVITRHQRYVSFLEAVAVSLAATGIAAGLVWLYGHGLTIPAIAFVLLASALCIAVYRAWRSRLRVIPYLELPDLQVRIHAAKTTIWSFQISGGEFTRYLVDDYRQWLSQDRTRKLKILFVNPDNEGLLESIVELSGMGKASNRETALKQLRETVKTSLRDYALLSTQMPKQIDLRVYDCSPPCSVHAVDVGGQPGRGSMFIENYLPDLPWRDRPCFLISRHAPSFGLYVAHCSTWFEDAQTWKSAREVLEST